MRQLRVLTTSKANARQVTAKATAKAQSTRQAILEAALRMASRDGLEGLTIGELAKTVGMSKSGVFAHFQSKDELQLSVLKEATARFVERVMKPAFLEPPGEARVQSLLMNWFSYLNDASLPGGSILIAASTELDDRPGILRNFVQDSQKELIRNIEKAAKISIETGDFKKDLDVEHFAWSLYSLVLGYHHFKRLLEEPKAGPYLRKSFEDLLMASRATEKKSAPFVKNKIRLSSKTK